MKRRMFVLGMGSATAGGSALLGTGAFTTVEAHRTVDIEVASDDEAYLQLYANPENPVADDLVVDDGDGHLRLDLDSFNEHATAELDDLFNVCNHGKQPVCVWLQKEGSVVQCTETTFPGHGRPLGGGPKKHGGKREERDAIEFYRDGDPDAEIDSVGHGLVLPVGACLQVGVDLCTTGVDEGTDLLPEGVTVYADVDGDCEPPEEPESHDLPGISFLAFCGQNLVRDDFAYSISEEKDDGDALEVEWEYSGPGTVETVVLKAATWFYNFDVTGQTSGTARVGDVEAVHQSEDGQSPSEPCPGGGSGVKFEFD